MVTVKTRPNSNEGYDVVILGANMEQTAAIRNALSDRADNRSYAKKLDERNGGEIMHAIRNSSALQEVHYWYKNTLRDVPQGEPDYEDEPDFVEEDEGDEFSDWN